MEINWKKNTALFLVGQALSSFGTMIVQYAILWHIVLKSQSGIMMTVFTVVGFLPMFFISPFAGVWADRYNRKNIINIADGAIAFFSLVVAVFLIFGIDNYGILLICAFARSLGQGVQSPAVGAFIPQIVPKEQLTKINGFQGSITSFVTLTSPMIAGALMAFAPLETLFFLDVITAAIGIIILAFFVKTPIITTVEEGKIKQNNTTYFYELKEGLKYIRNYGYVLGLIVINVIFLFLFAPAALLTPLQVTRNFGQDVWRLSVIEITFSVGMLAGGILIGIWGGLKNRIHTMALALVLMGLLIVGLGLMPNFWLYLPVLALIGVSMPLFQTPAMVLLQTKVEPSFMGRVLSIFTMTSSVIMPLSMILFGPLADIISVNIIFIVSGLSIFLLCIPMMASKTLREAG